MDGNLPIGIFDSGLGGLTVLKALKELLPNEQFIYYGDTAHLPYGEKSAETLIGYIQKITAFLKEKNCKLIVVACNSASTVLELIPNLPYNKTQIIDVIKPIIQLIGNQSKFHNIGIIGTRKTINSSVFVDGILAINPKLNLNARHTPLLVPAIEEGFTQQEFLNIIFQVYFEKFKNIELLIPACTHYPLIYKQIEKYFDHKVKVLNAPKVLAETVQSVLDSNQWGNTSTSKSNDEFYLSEITENFEKEAALFLEQKIIWTKKAL